jgi:periplasmic protein TonB
MFAESMLETSRAERTRRRWMTLTSFGLQALVIALLLFIPLLSTVGLPSGHVLQTPVSWGAPPPPLRTVERRHLTTIVRSNLSDNILITPPSIPPRIQQINEVEPPPQIPYSNAPGVPGGTGEGSREGVWKILSESLNRIRPPTVAPPASIHREFRTSTILEGMLIRKVQPVYPPLAKSVRIQGPVILDAVISKAGTIERLQLVSGHPMLVPAALEAVTQWRYRPYVLNGEAIEVETRITVNFILQEN